MLQAVPGEIFTISHADSFIKISRRNKEICDSSRAIYNADPNMIAERNMK